MSFPKDVVDMALVASGRCCCICHKFCGVRIETHHIRPKSKGGDDSSENCIPLCFDCHAEVEHPNDQHPRGRKFSENELLKHRDTWFSKVKELNTIKPLPNDAPQVTQLVSGKGNMVAGQDLSIYTERLVRKTVVQTDPGGKHISNMTARKVQELVKEYIDMHITAGKDSATSCATNLEQPEERIQRDQLQGDLPAKIPTVRLNGFMLKSRWQDPKSAGRPPKNGKRAYSSQSMHVQASLGFLKMTSTYWLRNDCTLRHQSVP